MQKQLRKYVDSTIAVNICKRELENKNLLWNICQFNRHSLFGLRTVECCYVSFNLMQGRNGRKFRLLNLQKGMEVLTFINILPKDTLREECRFLRSINGNTDKILTESLSYAPEYSKVFVIIWMWSFTFVLVGGKILS